MGGGGTLSTLHLIFAALINLSFSFCCSHKPIFISSRNKSLFWSFYSSSFSFPACF
jgi:hypothetical protein